MKKGKYYIGTAESVAYPNRAAVRVTGSDDPEDIGRIVTVKNVIPGRQIRFLVNKNRKDNPSGICKETIAKSPLETQMPCPHYGDCGGCLYQPVGYDKQLEIKENQVRKLLDGAVREPYMFEGILPSPDREYYRNKMEFTFGDSVKDGPLVVGLHRANSMYDVISAEGCRLCSPDFSVILQAVTQTAHRLNLSFYKKMTFKGYLRHLLVRRSHTNGGIMVDIVTSGQEQHDLTPFVEDILARGDELEGHISGILHTTNDSTADKVTDEATEVLYGRPELTETVLGLDFTITPFSFFQTNTAGAEVLYRKVREYVGGTEGKVLYDLYSGTGTIAQILAPVAREVIGVEIVPEAVMAAKENAARNGLGNCRFLTGDVLKVLDEIDEKPDIIVLDPPRDGVHPKALQHILSYGVDHIIYVSCKPTSLARDLGMIQDMGYRLVKAACVDLFPSTTGVETVCLLSS
ncbi:MAG: 23S rRNA (uracil(1939)-C(5))-methyltransferase RlmD [Lachnospiraceae bacterium]|jgi:23S rRNA (uracil1939-C5)-methyltransferase